MNGLANNHTFIARIAEDPIGCLPDWESAEESWQFLAACDEYYHCCIKRDRDYTALPVATDATCSGLQILAGLCRDASTASLVNVLPGKRPADAYRTVAEHAKPNVPDNVKPFMNRSTVKRVVMTIPYNAKPHSNRGYIKKALKEQGYDATPEELTDTVKAVRDTMAVIVPGPMAVMKWFEDEVSKAIRRGEQQLQWCTPSGFVVTQKLMKIKYQELQLQLLGKVRIKVAVEEDDTVDLLRHKAATAPNVIHSLDASLLHLASLRFDAPISLIHDSVLCRATDMDTLSTIVREVYMHLFAEHDYLKDFAAQIGAETEPPIIGDLKPESVIESTYFFLLMSRTTFVTQEPVQLEGYQAVMKPSKFGYSMVAIVGQDIVDQLEADRSSTLEWAQSKLKNPKRSVLKPEPWEEVADGQYKVKFSWNEENKPPVVDTEGTPVTDEATPVYSGATVKVAFYQKPYILKDGVTYGTSLKLLGVQLVSLNAKAGIDTGNMKAEDVTELFGKTEGFKASDPVITPKSDEEDF